MSKRKTYTPPLNEGLPVDTLDYANGDIIQPLYPYGVGVDCHSKFIEVCVFVRTGDAIRKFEGMYPSVSSNEKK